MTDLLHTELPSDPGTEPESASAAEQTAARRFAEEIILFDVADGGRILGGRGTEATRKAWGTCFWEHVSREAGEKAREYLFSFPKEALLLQTDLGTVLLRADLMPAASMGIAVLPLGDPTASLSLLGNRPAALWSERIPKQKGVGRKNRLREQRENQILEILTEMDQCFGNRWSRTNENELSQRINTLSQWVGCPVESELLTDREEWEAWDLPSFCAFLLVALCMCRRWAPSRELRLQVPPFGTEPSLILQMPPGLRTEGRPPELIWMEALANRQNMLLERSVSLTGLQLRIVPIRRDWAYLGIKAPKIGYDQKIYDETEPN